MKKALLGVMLCVLPGLVLAGQKYYLVYNVPGQKSPIEYGPMNSLAECQEDMAKFLGKSGNRIINPRCVKK